MSHSIEDLLKTESGDVWRYFSELSSIPRPSKHEEKVREYLRNIANANDWQCREDAVGNLVLSLPGVGSLINAPILIIQGHMDMVCEKNSDVTHDFMHDPISLTTDGDWVMADGTTLGSDNGIALAMMLAVAIRPVKNRLPLELLFTIDEETGLTGAMQLDPDILQGMMHPKGFSRFRSLHIVKNTFGFPGKVFGLKFLGESNNFETLPYPNSEEILDVYSEISQGL